jgi:hypothetical protein
MMPQSASLPTPGGIVREGCVDGSRLDQNREEVVRVRKCACEDFTVTRRYFSSHLAVFQSR